MDNQSITAIFIIILLGAGFGKLGWEGLSTGQVSGFNANEQNAEYGGIIFCGASFCMFLAAILGILGFKVGMCLFAIGILLGIYGSSVLSIKKAT